MARQDRLFTDVDRGFTALENGNLEDAEAALERCSKINGKDPDVVALAAAVADVKGDGDTAIAKYRELSTLRPDDPMPRVCLARLMLHENGDAEGALDTIESAFDFIDEEDDLIEAVMVRTEALLAMEDYENARESLGELSTSVIDDGHLALDLAELSLAAEDPNGAIRWVEVAQKDDALRADALHLRGRIHEAKDDHAGKVAAWKEVRALDNKAPAPTVTISEDELERIAVGALDELPEDVKKRLENVPILIDEMPSDDLINEGIDPRSLGLFQGTAMPDAGGAAPAVTNILLFKTNLERAAEDLDHLADEVRITVLHETAHYFGLDEEDLVQLGLD
jgi:predicted Zn-dependent protease with MMP-like domain/Flp pilus assembly protein TadD